MHCVIYSKGWKAKFIAGIRQAHQLKLHQLLPEKSDHISAQPVVISVPVFYERLVANFEITVSIHSFKNKSYCYSYFKA